MTTRLFRKGASVTLDKPGAGSLFLFDIDGTLLRGAPPVHRNAITAAAGAVYCVALKQENLSGTAGMTDHAIARRALRSAGLSDAGIDRRLPAFFAAAAEFYERNVPADLSAYLTPHVVEALQWLAAQGATLGLVTGNIQRLAWAKLRAAGLLNYFLQPGAPEPFPWIGGFGDEGEARDTLPPLALARAQAILGQLPPAENTWIIGDTPSDITCGLANGLRVIAVATGRSHSLEDLRGYNPTYAIPDLAHLATLPLWGTPDEGAA
jgi:phosphoglycolate phosphatase-like HAD superfamily hydrolase